MKQRILLVNKFYYRRGGDCVYLLNLEEMLRSRGHEVAVFAMDYPENISSEWSAYFAPEITFQGGAAQKLKAVGRTLGIGDINSSFSSVIDKFKPDVVHLNNIHSYLSPQLAKIAARRGIKVVWTLHDYKLLCPSYSCRCRGEICEACFTDKSQVVRRRCMKGSLGASVIAWLEAMKWDSATLSRMVDSFICPSEFMAAKMRQGGFPAEKIVTLNNFIAPEMWERCKAATVNNDRDDYYCYVGRLSEEKGVETLLKAAATLPYRLKIAGDGPLADELKKRYGGFSHIEFLGHLDSNGVNNLLSRARFSVIPSEWYENNPFSVIESHCLGTPVAGAHIGGIPELITPDNGVTFKSGDTASLVAAIEEARNKHYDYNQISRIALSRFSPDQHYITLDKIYRTKSAL
ncbi:MAG: glycosyltransferase [Muribaculum sp.]|nr:glycosyltransferase [Muribaculum sp.]MDE6458279.1 glycosyltransferase [Muribaculum sp.]